ncbi:TetR/AcrR family transcriptional regulator [Nitratireductor sp. XY-223]|uniref:TetR/AcrR family transcriptional regulator n=1 Tax=Nitratireductor sp. XY-223 TaxID=2561926 RepID=UPI0010AB3F75|nr:TetR/AcrR family transcriptional regulator [Nitratireductor sp. XY-223]
MTADTRRKPRQKRSKEKVDKILDAVEELVTRQSIEALTTTQIAEHTGLAVGTIYQYFGNRTELLIAAEIRMFERLAAKLAGEVYKVLSQPVGDPIEKLISIYIESAKAQPGYLQLLRFSFLNKPPGVNDAAVEEFAGDMISAFIRQRIPDIGDDQMEVTRRTVINILSVLCDVVLLTKEPEIQERIQAELVAHCKFALYRAANPDMQCPFTESLQLKEHS